VRLTILITFAVFVLIALVVATWAMRAGRREIDRNRVPPPDDEEMP
jgi:hypothetical protein